MNHWKVANIKSIFSTLTQLSEFILSWNTMYTFISETEFFMTKRFHLIITLLHFVFFLFSHIVVTVWYIDKKPCINDFLLLLLRLLQDITTLCPFELKRQILNMLTWLYIKNLALPSILLCRWGVENPGQFRICGFLWTYHFSHH